MQVSQWAGPIPMGLRAGLGPRAMSGGWGQSPDYFLGPGPVLNWQVIVELHVHVYVFRALLIKCEPTRSNSTLLRVSK